MPEKLKKDEAVEAVVNETKPQPSKQEKKDQPILVSKKAASGVFAAVAVLCLISFTVGMTVGKSNSRPNFQLRNGQRMQFGPGSGSRRIPRNFEYNGTLPQDDGTGDTQTKLN